MFFYLLIYKFLMYDCLTTKIIRRKIMVTKKKKQDRDSLTSEWIDKSFDWLKKKGFVNFFENNQKWFVKVGFYSVYIIALMAIVVSIVLPFKYSAISWAQSIILGIVAFISMFVVHYTAYKMLPALDLLIKNVKVQISSSAFLSVSCLFAGIFGIVAIIMGIILAINLSSFHILLAGVGVAIVCEYWMALLLSPAQLNVEVVKDTSAGEEFIGLLTFFMKGMLRLIPIIFGCAMVYALFLMITVLFTHYQYLEPLHLDLNYIVSVVSIGLLPLVGYLMFLGYYFTIDICRAILAIPGKLDKTK